MKITKVTVKRGRKVTIADKNEERFEILMDAIVEEKDEPQEMVHALRTILDKHLDSWEYELKGQEISVNQSEKIVVKTASDLIANEENPDFLNKEQVIPVIKKGKKEEEATPLICPKCNEEMKKKEGKDYYLCSKHWGYPDMIKAGQVREKRF